MIMPGVGYAIVASDCLAAHVKDRMPDARHLRLGLSMPTSLSRGSLRTILSLVRDRVNVCRNGKLTAVEVGRLERSFDYGEGDRWSTCVNWPDTYTASTTTGIPNVEVYIEADLLARFVFHTGAFLAGPLQLGTFQTLLNVYTNIWPSAPASDSQATGQQIIVAEAEDNWRRCVRVRLTTIDGYRFTALSAVEIAGRALAHEVRPGFHTPSRVYGPDLVLALGGTTREDLDSYSGDRAPEWTRPARR